MSCHRTYHATIVATLLYLCACRNAGAVVNTKIDRIIDLSSQLVKITERIQLDENPGLYKITLEPSHQQKLAYIDASINGQTLELADRPDGTYEVNLEGQSVSQPLVIITVYTQLLQPYPAEISQSERQMVRYQGLQSTLSPYLTKTITTRIKLPQSSRLESFTKATKMTTGTSKLTYGPFKDVQPNQADPLAVHYENNSPFVAVTHLTRTVDLSPWGNSIYVANQVKVKHVGAKLKGPFSRIEYQRDNSNGLSSVRNFAAELPKSAKDIYFRDAIGNISTSNIRHTSSNLIVGLKPRFPLFGGWVTDFNLGYRVSLSDYVNAPVSGNNYRLSIPFADVLFDSMFVEEAIVKITLPAGAKDIEVKGQMRFERLPDEISFSYLDFIGRPVLVFKKLNLVTLHLENKPLVIRYNYSKMYMLQEPFLLGSAAIGAILLLMIQRFFSTSGK